MACLVNALVVPCYFEADPQPIAMLAVGGVQSKGIGGPGLCDVRLNNRCGARVVVLLTLRG